MQHIRQPPPADDARADDAGADDAGADAAGAAGARRRPKGLRLIATTDLHATLLPWDYFAGRPAPGRGLARAAGLAGRLRAAAAASLLVDNGDFLQGSPLGDFVGLERGLAAGEVHPVIAAMNAAGYDAATIGNHEFDYGLAFLERALADARFPVVSANAALALGAGPRRDRLLLPPYALVDRELTVAGQPCRLRLGLIGLLPPQTTVWNAKHLAGRLFVRDILEAAAAWVPELREAGADIVVALAHTGIGAARHVPGMEDAAVPLARLPGIDVVLAGHSHQVFPGTAFAGRPGMSAAEGTIAGRPAVMAGAWGSHLGIVDLVLDHGQAGWRLRSGRAVARPVARLGADGRARVAAPVCGRVAAVARPWDAETRAALGRPAGATRVPLHSYFALVAPDPILALLAEAQTCHVRALLKGSPDGDRPVVSAVSPFRCGGRGGPDNFTDIAAGPLTMKDVAELFLYPNQLRALRLRGAEVAEWLERAAGQFRRVTAGAVDAQLVDPAFPCHNFDVIHGLTYSIDLTRPARYDAEGRLVAPAARRIRDLARDGQPLDPEEELILVTNDYRAAGGGRFPGCGAGRELIAGPTTNRAALAAHLAAAKAVAPATGEVWRFAPMPGTSVTFETGPGALAHLPAPGGRAILPAGPGIGGFLRFRLIL
ncbi:MAG: bifunctional 2',3'-cyclic-nucleotide 2'-phosphodiesterase/3'-nucleotidase [Rhodobacteraceae bacterium]|nr:bifunctional 2',3'-cyclic-nucleotide 2'-phosphodiesterase/3'-nucleotidase [Paracoccaceae bacterium]